MYAALARGRLSASEFLVFPVEEMSSHKEKPAISGADRFDRRVGTCRLHAIFMNQSCVYLAIAGEIFKQGSADDPVETV